MGIHWTAASPTSKWSSLELHPRTSALCAGIKCCTRRGSGSTGSGSLASKSSTEPRSGSAAKPFNACKATLVLRKLPRRSGASEGEASAWWLVVAFCMVSLKMCVLIFCWCCVFPKRTLKSLIRSLRKPPKMLAPLATVKPLRRGNRVPSAQHLERENAKGLGSQHFQKPHDSRNFEERWVKCSKVNIRQLSKWDFGVAGLVRSWAQLLPAPQPFQAISAASLGSSHAPAPGSRFRFLKDWRGRLGIPANLNVEMSCEM